ncbi:hypothetical protein [Mesorhizobium sp. B1-1-8]|uniref:hypothetical protein n=1 Tax=Mesorhizobium sp. B1-1-8 TaxID=2589976 RepID=UPI0039AEBC46
MQGLISHLEGEMAAKRPEGVAAREAPASCARPDDAGDNAGKNVIALDGRMVERLHLAEAEKLLAKAAAVRA